MYGMARPMFHNAWQHVKELSRNVTERMLLVVTLYFAVRNAKERMIETYDFSCLLGGTYRNAVERMRT